MNLWATEAHATIHRLSQNRRWSKRDITLLTERWPLSGNPPLLRESRQFIKDFGLTRSAKDVCYKWLHNCLLDNNFILIRLHIEHNMFITLLTR